MFVCFLDKRHTNDASAGPKRVSISNMCVCVSLAIDFSKTVEVIIFNLDRVTAADVMMHHVLIILTLTFIQGHTDGSEAWNRS